MSGPVFEGWLVVRDGLLPDRWRDRATPALVVPLLANESEQVLHAFTSVPADVDESLARLVAEGATDREIADHTGLSMRSVERRIARLRHRFGVDSKQELTRVLAELGFGGPADSASE